MEDEAERRKVLDVLQVKIDAEGKKREGMWAAVIMLFLVAVMAVFVGTWGLMVITPKVAKMLFGAEGVKEIHRIHPLLDEL